MVPNNDLVAELRGQGLDTTDIEAQLQELARSLITGGRYQVCLLCCSCVSYEHVQVHVHHPDSMLDCRLGPGQGAEQCMGWTCCWSKAAQLGHAASSCWRSTFARTFPQ